MIKYASLFSGIGGFELGIKAASYQTGIETECVFASEFDPESKAKDINKQPARILYNKNFGEYPHGDITKINASDVPNHDILVGGFPCQNVSIAGKREGLCGKKSGLFFDIVRIVREKQPEYILLENVAGLLSSNGGWDFARILIELEDAGYECEWEVRNTKAYLPQNRERVFIIGHLRESGGRQIFPITDRNESFSQAGDGNNISTGCISTRNQSGQAQWDGSTTLILCDSGQGRKIQIRSDSIAPLRANTGAGHNNLVAGCLTGGGHSGGNHSDMTIIKYGHMMRWLTPIECERLQGFPDNWTEGISDTQRYKCIGNSVTVPVVADIIKKILKTMV